MRINFQKRSENFLKIIIEKQKGKEYLLETQIEKIYEKPAKKKAIGKIINQAVQYE